ncbi:phosphotransferase [Mycolicibacterium goodii]|uniref:Phosphotransferase n=1 Tax=Mycolicibacterium goodii TaxID=134601 RepID=A0A0K0X962_MYCGD|nr:phosphotransferase [Mycolicibacterium goodii]
MQPTQNAVIERPDDLTGEWLTAALGAGQVTAFSVERIGTGQMSECYRVHLSYADGQTGAPASVVLKVAATDPDSRQTGLALGLYEREVRFYTDIAPQLGGGPVAACHHAAFDPRTGAFDLLLGDAAPATVGDELRGATVEQATLALSELGRVHGVVHASSGGAVIADWLVREAPISRPVLAGLYAAFVERYADTITGQQREVCERLVESFDGYLAAEDDRMKGLVHGDYRLDNMLFGDPGADRALTVVDWQTVTWGPALTDVAYFIGCALPVEVRREHYDALLRAYHQALGPDAPLTLDGVREEVRRQSFFGVMMAIVSSMLVERTERGDQMFMTMLERHCSHVLDTGALDILTAPAPVAPLRPAPEDDDAHPPGDEPLWNESWYFDFVDAAAGFGGWIRLGLIPNQDHAWINVLLCGPGLPTVALNDFHAAPPADLARVSGAGVELSLHRGQPLQSYRVTASGLGQAYDDPAALLRDEAGTPVDVTLDLTWTTVGVPYQYRVTPRYEIPCTVSGTVTVGEKRHRLDAVTGQRDHSWGARDWWSMEWVWSALHLDDDTHLHGVDIRIPNMPPIGIGYSQRGGELVELESVTAQHTLGADDLPVTTTLTLQPGDIEVTVDIQGHAPVKLTSAEGKVSQFPRAWARVHTADGRTGVGWLEWNRNLG